MEVSRKPKSLVVLDCGPFVFDLLENFKGCVPPFGASSVGCLVLSNADGAESPSGVWEWLFQPSEEICEV